MQGLVGVTGMPSDSELFELLMGVLIQDSGELLKPSRLWKGVMGGRDGRGCRTKRRPSR